MRNNVPFEVMCNAGCCWTYFAFLVFGGDFPVLEEVEIDFVFCFSVSAAT